MLSMIIRRHPGPMDLLIPILICLWSSPPACGQNRQVVEHFDPIVVDGNLTLKQLLDRTMETYPQTALLAALRQEATALEQRGDSWVAGALTASFNYRNGWESGAVETGAPEIAGSIEVPIWNWEQRDAGRQLAREAKQAGTLKGRLMKLQVAGLIRSRLWYMKIRQARLEMAHRRYEVAEQTTAIIRRRVELGDLPRADLLLARNEELGIRHALLEAEAELMHARTRFTSLTGSTRIPAEIEEPLSKTREIEEQHPALEEVNAAIRREKAEINWLESAGSGQTTVALGANSQKGRPEDESVNTITLEVSVPFGGEAHRAPEIASANLELANAMARRDHLLRKLAEALHEANHSLEVARTEIEIADQRREVAESHLQMMQLSFDAGEINLLDLLKIRDRAFSAILQAQEQEIKLQRDIALFNQVVGELP